MLCKDRNGNVTIGENSQDNILKLIYGTLPGRTVLKLLTKPVISRVVGDILSTKVSTAFINPFIKVNNIDMSDYNSRSYSSYNDFFTRELKPGVRNYNMDKNILISPADGRITAYKIDDSSVFKIKNSYYSIETITKSKKASEYYKNGYCVIVRLCVDNYHRYCYVDNGVITANKFIDGVLHTVNPEALNHYNIYKENCRECTVIDTENFGKIMQIEVGALMVGKIINNHTVNTNVLKATEKGKFEFGGSTVMVLIPENKVIIDEDILKNTAEGYETEIKIGEQIGIKS